MYKILLFIITFIYIFNCEAMENISISKKNFLQNSFTQKDDSKSNSLLFDAKEVTNDIELKVVGTVPDWLNGTFLRNGPGKYNVGNEHITHWFDGFAFIASFTFNRGKVFYKSSFLKSDQFVESIKENRVTLNGFNGKYHKLTTKHKSSDGQDVNTTNANITLETINDITVAFGETPLPIAFDLKTLNTIGMFDYNDKLKKSNIWECAHLKRDPVSNILYGFMIEYGQKTFYKIYQIKHDSSAREIVAEHVVDEPSYMHDFSITENYIILTAYPLVVNAIDLLNPKLSFIGAHRWEPERMTHIYIFDKISGKLVNECTAPSMFAYHHINAFEEPHNQINLYLSATNGIDGLLNAGSEQNKSYTKYLKHLVFYTDKPEVIVKDLSDKNYDLPRINDKFVGKQNTYFYSIWFNPELENGYGLTKYDLKNNLAIDWLQENHYAGEPIFVNNPNGTNEDDGVVLSLIFDKKEHKSYLLILEATTMKQLAQIFVPNPIPLGLHGRFFSPIAK